MTEPAALYTPQDLADRFHIAAQTVRDHAHTGAWPAVIFGPRTIRFTEEQVTAIIDRHSQQHAPAPTRRIGTRARRSA